VLRVNIKLEAPDGVTEVQVEYEGLWLPEVVLQNDRVYALPQYAPRIRSKETPVYREVGYVRIITHDEPTERDVCWCAIDPMKCRVHEPR